VGGFKEKTFAESTSVTKKEKKLWRKRITDGILTKGWGAKTFSELSGAKQG